LTPELVDTNTNQQTAPAQTATPVTTPATPVPAPTPADSQFSSAIEKLKENAQQGDTQP
jgi:hypothetical protein